MLIKPEETLQWLLSWNWLCLFTLTEQQCQEIRICTVINIHSKTHKKQIASPAFLEKLIDLLWESQRIMSCLYLLISRPWQNMFASQDQCNVRLIYFYWFFRIPSVLCKSKELRYRNLWQLKYWWKYKQLIHVV